MRKLLIENLQLQDMQQEARIINWGLAIFILVFAGIFRINYPLELLVFDISATICYLIYRYFSQLIYKEKLKGFYRKKYPSVLKAFYIILGGAPSRIAVVVLIMLIRLVGIGLNISNVLQVARTLINIGLYDYRVSIVAVMITCGCFYFIYYSEKQVTARAYSDFIQETMCTEKLPMYKCEPYLSELYSPQPIFNSIEGVSKVAAQEETQQSSAPKQVTGGKVIPFRR